MQQLELVIQRLEYADLPVCEIHPHPMNPRNFSDRFGCRVEEDKVNELMLLIQRNGVEYCPAGGSEMRAEFSV